MISMGPTMNHRKIRKAPNSQTIRQKVSFEYLISSVHYQMEWCAQSSILNKIIATIRQSTNPAVQQSFLEVRMLLAFS